MKAGAPIMFRPNTVYHQDGLSADFNQLFTDIING